MTHKWKWHIRSLFPYVDTNVFPLSNYNLISDMNSLAKKLHLWCITLTLRSLNKRGETGVLHYITGRVIDLFAVFHQTPARMSYQTMYIFIFNMDIDLDVIAMYLIRVSQWRALLLEWPQKVFRPCVWVVSRGRVLLIKSHNWYRA